MNVNSSFSSSTNDKRIRLYGKYPVGGANYDQNGLPSITISTVSGANANVSVVAIFGDGENLEPVLGNNKPGGIQTISVIDAGKSLISVPGLDLTGYGDGTAIVEGVLIPSFQELTGKWLNSDGLISDRNMKLQGLDYYIDYSYVIKSTVQFTKYKNVLRDLLHPGGTKVYSELMHLDEFTTPQVQVESQLTQESV